MVELIRTSDSGPVTNYYMVKRVEGASPTRGTRKAGADEAAAGGSEMLGFSRGATVLVLVCAAGALLYTLASPPR